MKRLSNDEIFMGMAILAGGGSTCSRRAVGCVLVNSRGHVIGVGRNGVPSKVKHCITSPCSGASHPSGYGLGDCSALHAEENALMQCRDPWEVHACYVTVSPCSHCVKLLINSSCRAVYFLEEYPQPEAKTMWRSVKGEGWYWLKTAPYHEILKQLITSRRAEI